ncbi:stage III sporulation protein AG [Aquibacillus kalidii]|uniref:stage III sporulation protein AG n=1 Tax=Aquibacillus kalidii TaxID=2762597 RepID=UPI002E2CBE01|nr:stage III sporulation protein AG [Aquibacillus kalidii]
MENPLKKLISQLKLKTEDGKKPTKMGYIIVIALIGVLVLIVGNMFQTKDGSQSNLASPETGNSSPVPNQTEAETWGQADDENKSDFIKDIETNYEKDLAELLEKISGVSNVEVMVNLDSTKQKVFEKNLVIGEQTTDETDQSGGERVVEDYTKEETVVIVRQGDQEVPLTVTTKKPEVRGVLVVA